MATVSAAVHVALPRAETGIVELDQILRGGIPSGSLVLLAGGPGMGKTTLALEFLANGAANGEPGLFLSVTEPVHVLERNAREYAFIDPKHLDEGRIRIVDLRAIMKQMGASETLYTFEDANALVDVLESIVKEYRVKRLVLDSITAVCQRLEEGRRIRDFIFRLGMALNDLDCTTMMTSETPPRTLRYSMFGVEEFIADGIIFLSELEHGNDLIRTLQVMKMRGTDHSRSRFMMDISEFGISLVPMLKRFTPEAAP